MKKIVFVVAAAMLSVAAFAQTKVAHVNFAELVQLCPEADEARATISAASQEAQETYMAMVEEFQTKYQQYESKASTWSDAIRANKEKELTDIQTRIQEFSQTVDAELQQQQQALMAPIYEKARTVITDLAKAGSYVYVFDVNSVIYYDESQSVDLTPQARTAMNIPEGRTLETLQAELSAQAQAAQQQ